MKKFMIISLVFFLVFSSCDWFKSQVGGTMKGTVNGATSGFVVLINNIGALDSITTLTESGLNALTTIVKGLGLIGSNGSYEVIAIPAGTYYALALVDANNNETLDSTDMIGWYGNDSTFTYYESATESLTVTITIPKTITFEEKENMTGINITRIISKADFKKYYDYITMVK